MYDFKFKEKILNLISGSLYIQRLNKKVQPLDLLQWQDRYFLVKCNTGRKVFLRYDKWFFLIEGLNKIPEIKERRHYKGEVRIKRDETKDEIQRERVERIEEKKQDIIERIDNFVGRERVKL